MELLNEYFVSLQQIFSPLQCIPLIGLFGLGLLIPSDQASSVVIRALLKGTILGTVISLIVLCALISALSLPNPDLGLLMFISFLPFISALIFYTIFFICLWTNLILCRRIIG